MTKCRTCGSNVRVESIERYKAENELQEMGVVLVGNAVAKHQCEACGWSTVDIPDLPGLLAAVAVYRVNASEKLRGQEIKFLRKVMEISAKDFADALGVSQETVSRWENGKIPMGPANERLLRLLVAFRLKVAAPGVPCDPEQISGMKINPVQSATYKPSITLRHTEMLMDNRRDVEGVWREQKAA